MQAPLKQRPPVLSAMLFPQEITLPPETSRILEKYRTESLKLIALVVLGFLAFLGIWMYLEFHDIALSTWRVLPWAVLAAINYYLLWGDGDSRRAGPFMVYGISVVLIINRLLSSPDLQAQFLNWPALSILAILIFGFRRAMFITFGVFSILISIYLISTYWHFFPVVFTTEHNLSYLSGPLLMLLMVVQVGRLLRELAAAGALSNQLLFQYLKNHRHLFSVITHDVSNLLSVATLSFEANNRQKMHQAAEEMRELAEAVRHIHVGVMEKSPARTHVSLKSVIDTSQFVFALHLKAKLLTMMVDYDDGLSSDVLLWTSGPILSHVILNNVVSNAIKFSPQKAPIRIRAKDADDQVAVEVIDAGSGFPEDVLSALRQGQQVDSRPGTEGEIGTGLGLANAMEMARRLDIQVEFERAKPNGTVVRLTVPKAPPAGQKKGDRETAPGQ
jgi:signal transduction histidine kinase